MIYSRLGVPSIGCNCYMYIYIYMNDGDASCNKQIKCNVCTTYDNYIYMWYFIIYTFFPFQKPCKLPWLLLNPPMIVGQGREYYDKGMGLETQLLPGFALGKTWFSSYYPEKMGFTCFFSPISRVSLFCKSTSSFMESTFWKSLKLPLSNQLVEGHEAWNGNQVQTSVNSVSTTLAHVHELNLLQVFFKVDPPLEGKSMCIKKLAMPDMLCHGTVCQLHYHGGGCIEYKRSGKSFLADFARAPNLQMLGSGRNGDHVGRSLK